MATINTAVMFGVACMQTLSGLIIGAFEPLADGARTESAYRALFGVLTVVLIIAVAITAARRISRPATKCAPAGNSTRLELHAQMYFCGGSVVGEEPLGMKEYR